MSWHEFPYVITKCANCGGSTTSGTLVIKSKNGSDLSVCGIDCRNEKLEKLKKMGLKIKNMENYT